MVVGYGLIASIFIDDYGEDDNFIIFASGVSNSLETDVNEFKREENLLTKKLLENENKHLIYFSSFIDSNFLKKKYVEHKLNMEKIISESNNKYTIIKLPQVIGYGGNNHELVNFIVSKIRNGEEITVYKNTYKSLIDADDVKRIVDVLLKKWGNVKLYVEIPFIEKLKVEEIVNLISKQLSIEAKINFIDVGINDFPELSLTGKMILNYLNIIPVGYTEKVIKKYVK